MAERIKRHRASLSIRERARERELRYRLVSSCIYIRRKMRLSPIKDYPSGKDSLENKALYIKYKNHILTTLHAFIRCLIGEFRYCEKYAVTLSERLDFLRGFWDFRVG